MIYLQQPEFKTDDYEKLYSHYFPIFYLGTLVAYIYISTIQTLSGLSILRAFSLHKCNIKWSLFRLLYCHYSVTFYIRYEESNKYLYGNYWSIFMLLMLFSALNTFSSWLENIYIFRKFGQFSFGTYLAHIIIYKFVCNFFSTYSMKNSEDRLGLAFVLIYIDMWYGFSLLHRNMDH